MLKNILSLSRDLVMTVRPEQILHARKTFRPFRKFQDAWINYIYPGMRINTDISPWFYLQKFMLPLIKQHASFYHLQGIKLLELDGEKPPEFKTFQRKFKEISNGFVIEPVTGEIPPHEYFSLIRERRFPCVEKMRDHNELFCGLEPDFWHEAIGHLAPLCFPAVQEFYVQIAEKILTAKSKEQFNDDLAVAWTLMEYGFLKQNGKPKMFGAALVGSHLAHMRLMKGLIGVEVAERRKIIQSGFSVGGVVPKDREGRLRFFCMERLDAFAFS